MPNRVTGLSGMDIEGMVSSMMSGAQTKVDKLYKQKTLLTWRQEAYKNMSSSLSSFQNKYLSFSNTATNLKSSSFFLLKNFSTKLNGSDSSAVTVKNTAISKNVEHKLSIIQLAQKQKITGSASETGYSKRIISEKIDVDSLKDDMSLELNLDGKKVKFELTGVESAFRGIDEDTGIADENKEAAKFSWLTGKMSGKFAEFGQGTGAGVGNKVRVSSDNDRLIFETEAGRTLAVSSFSNGYMASDTFTYKKDNVKDTLKFDINGGDGNGGVTISVSTLNDKGERVTAEELAKRINQALKDKGINGASDEERNLVVFASGSSIKFEAKSETEKYTIAGGADSVGLIAETYNKEFYGKMTSELGVATGASTDNTSAMTVEARFGDIDFDTVKIGGKSLRELGIDEETYANMSVKQMIDKINDAELGVTVSYNTLNGIFSMESGSMGESNGFTLSQDAIDMFGFSKIVQADENGRLSAVTGAEESGAGSYKVNGGGAFYEAQDARFIIDGLETTRETNDVTLGELSLTLNEVTGRDNSITIKSTSDTDKIINNIKDFISSYNELLGSFMDAYTETRAKNGNYTYYEPLTDKEKSAMSDKDVELWEEKAKQGLLSRDQTVSKVIDTLRSAMSSEVKLADGRKISLHEIGISSTNWKDMGKLTVDEDKLRKALEERPEDVAALFSQSSSEGYYGDRAIRNAENGLAYRLDDIVQDATRSTPHPKNKTYGYFVELVGSKTAKLFDNSVSRKLKDLNEKISNMETSNLAKENRYYNMFSKMEQAMTKAQKQMSSAGLG